MLIETDCEDSHHEHGKQPTSSDEANGIAQCQRCQNRDSRAGKDEVRKGEGGNVGGHVCVCSLSNDDELIV